MCVYVFIYLFTYLFLLITHYYTNYIPEKIWEYNIYIYNLN